jgi:hypothetical protein
VICSVSTVKDTLANLELFVGRNLAAGADHMFVFLDGDDEATHAYFADHPHVTAVLADAAFWGGEKPDELNVRQVSNANLVNTLLAPFDCVDWLFHIDGDECLDIDKEQLAALEPTTRYVRLMPREAVSQRHWDGEVTLFKELLGADELNLLALLGMIPEPRNIAYFNGHVTGKVGIRPALNVDLHIHRAERRAEPYLPSFQADFLHVLHYESFSGEEFVRKWASHIGTGGGTRFKVGKMRLRAAISAVVTNERLSDERKRHYLAELYQRNVEDDIETLSELGLLVEPAKELHGYVPATFPQDQRELVDELLGHLLAADKAAFRFGSAPTSNVALLQAVRSELSAELGSLVDACVARTPSAVEDTDEDTDEDADEATDS